MRTEDGNEKHEPGIMKNYLLKTVMLQAWEKRMNQLKLPTSVVCVPCRQTSATGRAMPVASGLGGYENLAMLQSTEYSGSV
jgi:hypothetical protein